jgi:hypothetical protein
MVIWYAPHTHLNGCDQFHGEDVVSEEAEENGERREVEEASSVVIVPGNVVWNDQITAVFNVHRNKCYVADIVSAISFD